MIALLGPARQGELPVEISTASEILIPAPPTGRPAPPLPFFLFAAPPPLFFPLYNRDFPGNNSCRPQTPRNCQGKTINSSPSVPPSPSPCFFLFFFLFQRSVSADRVLMGDKD